MDAQTIAQGLDRGSRSGEGWTACCPAHDDRTPSLSITDSADSVLVHCHAGCSQDEVIDALKAKGLWEPKPNGSAGPSARRRGKIVATYDYVTEQGELATQCHFCHTRYSFSAAEVEAIIEDPDAESPVVH